MRRKINADNSNILYEVYQNISQLEIFVETENHAGDRAQSPTKNKKISPNLRLKDLLQGLGLQSLFGD